MMCSLCKTNDATVHLTQVVGDKLEKIDLCETCAQEKGVSDTTGFHLAELLLGMSGTKGGEAGTASSPSKSQLKCPQCGYTQADLKKTARLGCPECYVTFADSLKPMLKSMHRGTKHIGKVPGGIAPAVDPGAQIKSVQRELEKAVAAEDYERAAELRDQLKTLKASS